MKRKKALSAADRFIAKVVANPEKYRKRFIAALRKERPDLSEERLSYVAEQFGFRDTRTRQQKFNEALRDLLENTEKYRLQAREEQRKESPEMTEEQLDATWEQAAHQFGL